MSPRRGRLIKHTVKTEGTHRVVPSGDPVDSDVEVYSVGEALLPVVTIMVRTPGALQAYSCFITEQKGSFVKKLVRSPCAKEIMALRK